MVTSATMDAFQFSVGEARKSFARVEAIASLYPHAAVKHTIIESPHAYNQPMREAMYGWMSRNLNQTGDGSPIADPEIRPEDPEVLRCYPNDTRPADFMTIPRFAAAEAARLAMGKNVPPDRASWEESRMIKRQSLIKLLGGLRDPSRAAVKVENAADGKSQTLTFETEPGLSINARRDLPEKPGRLAIMLDVDHGAEAAFTSDFTNKLRDGGWAIVTPELRATGTYAVSGDEVRFAPDHNSAEWSLWIGRPLLGQWVHDIRRTLDALAERDGSLPHDVMITGRGPSGLIALCAAALDERITRATAVQSLASYVTDQPYRNQRLGTMVPGVLRDFGDVGDIAALVAPRAVTIKGGTNGVGAALEYDSLAEKYQVAKRAFELMDVPNMLIISSQTDE
jgi:hypothetical protein